jgi:predicted DNA-binding ribbon-helix-helix protein
MKSGTIRTSVDLPRPLHQKLRDTAAKKGCSVHELILTAIEQAIEPPRRKQKRLNLERGLVPRTGKPISITNEEIYELGFP